MSNKKMEELKKESEWFEKGREWEKQTQEGLKHSSSLGNVLNKVTPKQPFISKEGEFGSIEVIEIIISDLWEITIGFEGVGTGYPKFVDELKALLQEREKEAVDGFIDFCWNNYRSQDDFSNLLSARERYFQQKEKDKDE